MDAFFEEACSDFLASHARSRVSSYDWFGSLALQPLGYALIGPLAGLVGVSTALYLCGTLEIAAVGALLAVKDVRRLKRISSSEASVLRGRNLRLRPVSALVSPCARRSRSSAVKSR